MASKALMRLPSAWRGKFQEANFAGANFFCEVGSYESGHRLVIHEFPKKDKPYTESMGKRYYSFQVRGYCIQSATERNYLAPRDELQDKLDSGDFGMLQLPFMRPKHVACRQYKMTEEDRRGGYVTFDMQFVEASELPFKPTPAPRARLLDMADHLLAYTLFKMAERHDPDADSWLYRRPSEIERLPGQTQPPIIEPPEPPIEPEPAPMPEGPLDAQEPMNGAHFEGH